jgi:tetratricopeptide (TPR) repeat protein
MFAQEISPGALVDSGIVSYDKGDYNQSIAYYDKAIAKYPELYLAYYEKSLSLFSAERYEECAELCKSVLKRFPDGEQNKGIYINYGSALDGLGKSEEAITVYNKGIKKYPDVSLLHFNKAVTLYLLKNYEDAADELKSAIFLNPAHASSHQFLAYSVYGSNKLAGVLALTNFLLLEPQGNRAAQNLKLLLTLLNGNVQKKEDNVINITMTMGNKDDKKPDNFKSQELMMSLTAASDLSEKNKDKNVAQKLEHKLALFPGSSEKKVKRKTFFHDYYLPLLEDMQKDSLLETASYIIYASSDDVAVQEWLDSNKDKVKAFYKWFNAYNWRKED